MRGLVAYTVYEYAPLENSIVDHSTRNKTTSRAPEDSDSHHQQQQSPPKKHRGQHVVEESKDYEGGYATRNRTNQDSLNAGSLPRTVKPHRKQ